MYQRPMHNVQRVADLAEILRERRVEDALEHGGTRGAKGEEQSADAVWKALDIGVAGRDEARQELVAGSAVDGGVGTREEVYTENDEE